MISLLALGVTLAACIGAGACARWLVRSRESQPLDAAFSLALGLGGLSLLIFLLGLGQMWNVWAFRVVTVLIGLAGCAHLARTARLPRMPRLSASEILAAALLALLFTVALLGACAPVTDWDGLSYHLAVPELYLRHGGIYWISFIHHSNFPFATEMLYAAPVALGSPPAAKVIHWVFYVLMAAAAGGLATELYGKGAAIWAALAAALIPAAVWEAQAAYIDLSTAACMLLSATALLRYFAARDNGRCWLVIAALLAGMAAGTKTFALGWVALSAIWLLFDRRGKSAIVKDPAIFLTIAILTCSPWYVKSLIMTSNPVYPFLYSVFGGKAWGEAGAEMYRQSWTAFGAGRSPGDFLMLPWNLLARGGDFIDGAIIFGSAGPLLAALVPAAVLRLRGHGRTLAVAVLGYTLVWFALSQQTRYLLPVLGLASVIACAATVGRDRVAKAARAAVLAAGAVSVLLACALALPAFEVMSGAVDRDTHIQRFVNSYEIARRLPENTRLLLYREPRGFYFPQQYMWADEMLSSVIPYEDFSSPAEMLAWLKARGWQAALINWRFADPSKPGRDLELWQGAISAGLVRPFPGTELSDASRPGVEVWEIP